MDSVEGKASHSLSLQGIKPRQKNRAKARARRQDTIGHLGPEAVVAFVDGEMEPKSMHRVRVHLVHCPECRSDVHEQRNASEWLRHCNMDMQVRAPQSLMDKLANIAAEVPKIGPDADTPAFHPQQDFLDKVEMVFRAIKRNQRG